MALLFYDGFDDLSEPSPQISTLLSARYSTVASYTVATASNATLIPPPLNGGNALTNSIQTVNAVIVRPTVGNHTSGIVGVRVLYDSRLLMNFTTSVTRIVQLYNTSILEQLCICVNTDNKLEVRRGNQTGTLLGISSHIFQPQTWHYIEFSYTIDSTSGAVTIKVDGNQVLALSGINTQAQATATIASVGLCSARSAATWWYDDFYVVDTTGPSPYNTFLGGVKVLSLKPDGTGSIANWTASSGTTWAAIDDITLYNSTDFVYTSASNNTDLYTLTNLTPTGSSIYAVKSVVAARKADAATATLAPIISTGGILYSASSDFTITTTTTEYSTTFTINPSTSIAWTVSDINSLQSGFKSTT